MKFYVWSLLALCLLVSGCAPQSESREMSQAVLSGGHHEAVVYFTIGGIT